MKLDLAGLGKETGMKEKAMMKFDLPGLAKTLGPPAEPPAEDPMIAALKAAAAANEARTIAEASHVPDSSDDYSSSDEMDSQPVGCGPTAPVAPTKAIFLYTVSFLIELVESVCICH